MLHIKNHIREYRLKHRISQQSLADELGISLTTLNKIEEERMIPGPRLMIKVSDYFGVELQDMFYYQKILKGGNFI